MLDLSLEIQPIGVIRSPYKEKFSVPRQPNLVEDGTGILELLPPYNQAETVRGLSEFSHLWLIFQFDKIPQGKWHPTVRPPRLGGNKRVGVFASRSTYRPNPLGLSKVRLNNIEIGYDKVWLHLGSLDLVDGTPVFDIKPYIAYSDNEPEAQCSFAQFKPQPLLKVELTPIAKMQLKEIEKKQPHFLRFVVDVISQDPRPAYQQGKIDLRIYGTTLYDFNIRWKIKQNTIDVAEVLSIQMLKG
ncbi:tRNA (N6-threonylcarbamoyladenosine(37)-N6)-methyltransferase TrmO [Seminibacterium arietis]|uniref:tRNA (N6-threonylcarbamoyladenosine(37)-N6)-methyltransferase TrmO n=1 Tax=Seminibacterium arietis TaxID=1173502 RepID=A0ABW3IBG7_9PAST